MTAKRSNFKFLYILYILRAEPMTASQFISRLSTLQNVIWYYARNYEIHGVLEADDLYQEGLMELNKMSQLDQYRDLPKSTFNTYFRTRFMSRLKNRVRHHTSKARDWRSTVFVDDMGNFVEEKEDPNVTKAAVAINTAMFDYLSPSPADELEHQHKLREAEAFIDEVKAGLDPEAQWLFEQRLHGDVPEQLKGEFKRIPGHASVTVLGMIFGWGRGKTWRVLNRVRRRAAAVIQKKVSSGSSNLWSNTTTKRVVRKSSKGGRQ